MPHALHAKVHLYRKLRGISLGSLCSALTADKKGKRFDDAINQTGLTRGSSPNNQRINMKLCNECLSYTMGFLEDGEESVNLRNCWKILLPAPATQNFQLSRKVTK
eukprot:g63204.t1